MFVGLSVFILSRTSLCVTPSNRGKAWLAWLGVFRLRFGGSPNLSVVSVDVAVKSGDRFTGSAEDVLSGECRFNRNGILQFGYRVKVLLHFSKIQV